MGPKTPCGASHVLSAGLLSNSDPAFPHQRASVVSPTTLPTSKSVAGIGLAGDRPCWHRIQRQRNLDVPLRANKESSCPGKSLMQMGYT